MIDTDFETDLLARPTRSAETARREIRPVLAEPPAHMSVSSLIGAHVANATQSTIAFTGYAPISQLIATARAAEVILGLTPPEGAVNVRRVSAYAELLTIHASLLPGSLSGPDGLPIFCDSQSRPSGAQLAELSADIEQFAAALQLRLVESAAHRPWIVPGGVYVRGLDKGWHALARRAAQLARATAKALRDWDADFDRNSVAMPHVALPAAVIGLTSEGGDWAIDGARLRVIDAAGKTLECSVTDERLDDVLDVLPASDVAAIYYRPYGAEHGRFVSGALARVNVAERFETPEADAALKRMRQRFAEGFRHRVIAPVLAQHARLIETIAALESLDRLLNAAPATSPLTMADLGGVRDNVGVGMHEAPFGTLIHRLAVDDDGVIIDADIWMA